MQDLLVSVCRRSARRRCTEILGACGLEEAGTGGQTAFQAETRQ